MDSRYSFICLLAGGDTPIYFKGNASNGLRQIHDYWHSLGFKVEKWRGKGKKKHICFYRKRFTYHKKNSETRKEYIIVPSLRNPKWIILNNKEIIANHGLIIKPTSLKARLIWWIAKLSNRFGQFTFIFPDRIVLNNSYLGKPIFNDGGSQASILYTGTPGKFQKFTIQYVDNDFKPVYFLKLANSVGGKERIRKEVKVLGMIAAKRFDALSAPEIICVIDSNEFYGFLQNNILMDERISFVLSDADIFAVIELYKEFGFKEVPFSEYINEIGIENFANEMPNAALGFKRIMDEEIILGFSHGDYIPWNRFHAVSKVKIIDWETQKHRPLFYDICFFLVNVTVLVNNSSIVQAVKKCEAYMKKMLPGIGILDRNIDLRLYMLLILMEMFVHYKNNNEESDNDFLRELSDGIERLLREYAL